MKIMFKISIILFFLLSFTDCGISQDVTSDKQEHILVEIEDSGTPTLTSPLYQL